MTTPDGVEATLRVNEDKKYLFLLNHAPETKTVIAEDNYYDLISGKEIGKGEEIVLHKADVMILEIR